VKLILRRRHVTIILIIGFALLALWLLGFASSYTMGGFIYVALLVGIIMVFVAFVTRARIRGR
jgi:Family of unknown function (DUF5670)